MKKSLAINTLLFSAVLILSNYLIQSFSLLGATITWSVFLYPITFFICNMVSKQYGAKKAWLCLFIGLALQCAVFCIDMFTFKNFTLNFVFAELLVIILGQGLNIFLFSKLSDSKKSDFKYVFGVFIISVIFDNIIFLFLGSIAINLTFDLLSVGLSIAIKLVVAAVLAFANAKIKSQPARIS